MDHTHCPRIQPFMFSTTTRTALPNFMMWPELFLSINACMICICKDLHIVKVSSLCQNHFDCCYMLYMLLHAFLQNQSRYALLFNRVENRNFNFELRLTTTKLQQQHHRNTTLDATSTPLSDAARQLIADYNSEKQHNNGTTRNFINNGDPSLKLWAQRVVYFQNFTYRSTYNNLTLNFYFFSFLIVYLDVTPMLIFCSTASEVIIFLSKTAT